MQGTAYIQRIYVHVCKTARLINSQQHTYSKIRTTHLNQKQTLCTILLSNCDYIHSQRQNYLLVVHIILLIKQFQSFNAPQNAFYKAKKITRNNSRDEEWGSGIWGKDTELWNEDSAI